MTRDIFDTNVGTLDVVIYAALRLVALVPLNFSHRQDGMTLDAICEHNARMFVDEFIGEPIAAIKIIREASGLNLKDSKEAWEQTVETYYGTREYHIESAIKANRQGKMDAVRYHLSKV